MKPTPLLWFAIKKDRKRPTFNIKWGHSPTLNGWDLMLWQRICQEWMVAERVAEWVQYHADRLPQDCQLIYSTPAAESGEMDHCPDFMVEKIRDIVVTAQEQFERKIAVGAHNE